jgi:DNA-binding MarR family transcriptional regulator
MALRPSQVETLRVFGDEPGKHFGVLELADRLGITPWSAWKRLDRLGRSGHLERVHYSRGQVGYRLTQLGKEALESSESGEGR